MRTTLTLDKDVAAMIERLRKTRGDNLKSIVNEALREGLRQMTAPRPKRNPVRTQPVDLGRCLIDNVDDVAEVIAIAESDAFK